MPCLKCGRETDEKNVFCDACVSTMADMPVKPGTRITIPVRPKAEPPRPVEKKQSPEELIEKLHSRIKLLLVVILILVLSLCVTVGILVHQLSSAEEGGFGIGQNYSTEAPDNVDHGR